jgi:hypothetical protein
LDGGSYEGVDGLHGMALHGIALHLHACEKE